MREQIAGVENARVEITGPHRRGENAEGTENAGGGMQEWKTVTEDLKIHISTQGRIIQCAQCARAHEAPPHWRPHHQADVKTVMLKFVIEL